MTIQVGANDRDCWNCGRAAEMERNGILGEKPCAYAEQMMRNPCRGWQPSETLKERGQYAEKG